MRTHTIGLIQVKGGAGRSTVATNLAGELSKAGSVLLIDGDMPQGTSASWYAVRREAEKAKNIECQTATNHHELIATHERYAGRVDYIVIDGPPRIAEMTRATLMLADICLVPLGASVAEVWAANDVLTLIEEARRVRPVTVRIVWTRHRAYTSLARELSPQTTKALELQALKTTLGLRVAYPEALGAGLTVAEVGDPVAREELAGLVRDIQRILK